MRVVAPVVILFLIGTCTGSTPPPQASPRAQTTCSAPSDLEVYSYQDNSGFAGYGLARVGHVWFSAFGRVTGGKARIAEGPGLVKVVIATDPDLKSTVELRGISCLSGKALRFCYDSCSLPHQPPFTTSELETMGSDRQLVAPTKQLTGYLLCPQAGLYRISGQVGDKTVGTVTLDVGNRS
jgi:hypothetical protein